MIFLNSDLLLYGLHDTQVSNIKCYDSKFILNFENGFYNLNENQKLLDKTDKSKMIIDIKDLNDENIGQYITITKKGNKKELNFKYFLKKVERFGFEINLDYYSQFANSLLLKGQILNVEFELIITDIKKIYFLVENI